MGNIFVQAPNSILGYALNEPYSWGFCLVLGIVAGWFGTWLAAKLWGRYRTPTLDASVFAVVCVGAFLLGLAWYKGNSVETMTYLDALSVAVGLAVWEWIAHRRYRASVTA